MVGKLISKSGHSIQVLRLDKSQRKTFPCFLYVIRNLVIWPNEAYVFRCGVQKSVSSGTGHWELQSSAQDVGEGDRFKVTPDFPNFSISTPKNHALFGFIAKLFRFMGGLPGLDLLQKLWVICYLVWIFLRIERCLNLKIKCQYWNTS